MSRLAFKIKPKSGFSHPIHITFVLLLPALLYIFVQWNFTPVALSVIILSKWRMFAVRPRHWWPNIRANAVDIIVGISALVFMVHSGSQATAFIWTMLYGLWLLILKPKSSIFYVAMQAGIGQIVGLSALFLGLDDAPAMFLVLGAGLVSYLSARHFLANFDEPHAPLYAHTWGYFAASLTWVLSHWLLFYGFIAQPTLILVVFGSGLATLYYLDQNDRLSKLFRRQFIFIMIAILIVIIAFSDWGDKSI
jgi:hypothetical protein